MSDDLHRSRKPFYSPSFSMANLTENVTDIPISYEDFERMANEIYIFQEEYFCEITNDRSIAKYIKDILKWQSMTMNVNGILARYGVTDEQYENELMARFTKDYDEQLKKG